MGNHATIAILLFLLAYGFIISEKIHRTIVSLTGAVAIVVFGILSQEEAVTSISFNTIGLLIGMMLIVAICRRSGLFEYMSIKAAKTSQGDPIKILVLLAVLTAVLSALLDNVTTVLLIVPVTMALTNRLNITPMPFLITEIIASNIGGAATLIGDPPNILIGSATGLDFVAFVVNLAPVIVIILAVTVAVLVYMYRGCFQVSESDKQKIMQLDELAAIKDFKLLKKSLAVLGMTILGFCFHQFLHLESATVALAGAVLLMLIAREEPEDILLSVEWPTIFFFVGLFILVEALVKVGVIEYIARETLTVTQGDLTVTALLLLWISGIASAIVDNIPFVTAMIPLVKSIGNLTGMPLEPLWWSLSLGACLGGNGTLIGASANVVVAGIGEKHGVPIGFVQFLKVGFPLMILSLIISTVYVYLRYLS